MKKGRIIKAEQNKRVRYLLEFIFNFRYATLKQIHTFIHLIMFLPSPRRLLDCCFGNGYLTSYYEQSLKTKIYYLTQKGKDLLYSDEPLVEHYYFDKTLAGVNTFIHHNILIEVYFLLKSRLNIKEWINEWILRIGRKKRDKIPDGLIILPNGAKVALEVESRYKKLAVLKSLVRMYEYDIEKALKYNCVLMVSPSRPHYEGLKKRLFVVAPTFCSRKFILADMIMLEGGVCFYQGEQRPIEEAFELAIRSENR